MTVTVLVLQTWFDISIQYTGSVMSAYAIAFANGGRSITDDPAPGEIIIISNDILIFKKEVQHLEFKKARPATAIKKELVPPGLGIEYMRVGINFKVG